MAQALNTITVPLPTLTIKVKLPRPYRLRMWVGATPTSVTRAQGSCDPLISGGGFGAWDDRAATRGHWSNVYTPIHSL